MTRIIETSVAFPDHGFSLREAAAAAATSMVIDPRRYDELPARLSCVRRVGGVPASRAPGVYDPMRQELYTASRGDGAQLDGRRIRVSKQVSLEGALVGTGFPYRENVTHIDAYMTMLKTVMQQAAGIRRPGAAALDLAYVAAGRIDAFWEIGLHAWDTAAGTLLITESGGRVGTLTGGEYIQGGNIIAGTPRSTKRWLPVCSRTCRRRCADSAIAKWRYPRRGRSGTFHRHQPTARPPRSSMPHGCSRPSRSQTSLPRRPHERGSTGRWTRAHSCCSASASSALASSC